MNILLIKKIKNNQKSNITSNILLPIISPDIKMNNKIVNIITHIFVEIVMANDETMSPAFDKIFPPIAAGPLIPWAP